METQTRYPLSVNCLSSSSGVHGAFLQHRLQQHRLVAPESGAPSPKASPCFAPTPADFEIDDLLDFPDSPDHAVDESLAEAPKSSSFAEKQSQEQQNQQHGAASKPSGTELHPGVGICNLPPAELANELEWLSGFNEDSSYTVATELVSFVNSSVNKNCELTPLKGQETRDIFIIQSPISVLEPCPSSLNTNIPKRSRKARLFGRVWTVDILKPRHKDVSESTSMLISKSSSNELFWPSLHQEGSERPPKKPKKSGPTFTTQDSVLARRCSHCLVQKTPQWRAGPLGPKTLCNACGVRYKSGRLVPEYRPACSPTFLSEVHSNSHRRIMEMRRAKELGSKIDGYLEKYDQMHEEDCDSQSESCKVSSLFDESTIKLCADSIGKEVSSACGSCTLSGQSTICEETTSMFTSETENTNPVCYDEITSSEQALVRIKEGTNEQDSVVESHEACKDASKGSEIVVD